MTGAPASEIARHVWDSKYRAREAGRPVEAGIDDTWRRVAVALAAMEPGGGEEWARRFHDLLADFRFLPGGRILAGAGTDNRVTLFNCFVMGAVEDSLDRIFDALKEGALTLQQGGGVGYDFSTLRPRGVPARTTGTIASGPVSFMAIWDSMCATLLSTGARRGAMMATLRCDHPDILEFIAAKRTAGALRHFNLSVQVTDAFMDAVEADEEWPLVFPAALLEDGGGETVRRHWPGTPGEQACRVMRRLPAREVWARIMRATYEYAEPGVLFVDRINEMNNLHYREEISATNPCGEIPLPPYGACDLGSLNLSRFVREPFTERAHLDERTLLACVPVAVRLLDNVIDLSRFPLPAQREQARGSRRLGLGITGLADALILLGMEYGSEAACAWAGRVMKAICHAAYRASIELAREKGPFPFFERDAFLAGAFIRALPDDIRDGIARSGLRNSHLLAIAPTGTISLLAGNVSSGIEPVFTAVQRRRVLELDGGYREFELGDPAVAQWREGHPGDSLPPAFTDSRHIEPRRHLAMQAALQPYVDNAISKTINIPEDCPLESFESVYHEAWRLGLKGCTTYRPNPVTGAVLEPGAAPGAGVHCCGLERQED